jgi:transketolase N-terminal domain/subunit
MTTMQAVQMFEALLERYEAEGWNVRTIDRTNHRATVRLVQPSTRPQVPIAICRRLWIDQQGVVQETNVPC